MGRMEDNEVLRTKNDSKRMLVTVIDAKSEAEGSKRLTSKDGKGKATLRTESNDVHLPWEVFVFQREVPKKPWGRRGQQPIRRQ